MEPDRNRDRNKQYQPRWRHFHPQDTLYMSNPFDKDIVFQVADEHNQPYQYRLPANKVCELPGGAVATLGLKEVVDRLIGESKTDAIRIWEPSVRQKYEDQVIVRIKEARQRVEQGPQGIVNLGSDDDEFPEDEAANKKREPEEEFPGARKDGPPSPPPPAKKKGGDDRVAATAAASLGAKNQVIEED